MHVKLRYNVLCPYHEVNGHYHNNYSGNITELWESGGGMKHSSEKGEGIQHFSRKI